MNRFLADKAATSFFAPPAGDASVPSYNWIPLDPAYMAGGTAYAGSYIASVETPWTFTGKTVEAACTITDSHHYSISRMYSYTVPTTALFAALGLEEADFLSGKKAIMVGLTPHMAPGSNAQCGPLITRSTDGTGDPLTLRGAGGGYAQKNDGTVIYNCVVSDGSNSWGESAQYLSANPKVIARIECTGPLTAAYSILEGGAILAGSPTTAQLNTTFAGNMRSSYPVGVVGPAPVGPLFLTFKLGSRTGGTPTRMKADVHFAVTDGQLFEALPD